VASLLPDRKTWATAIRVSARGVADLGDYALIILVTYCLTDLAMPYPAARWMLQSAMTLMLFKGVGHIVRNSREATGKP
jgi:predicted ferric reductase